MLFKKKSKVEPSDQPEEVVDEESESSTPKPGMNKGISKLDFVMRIVAAISTLGSAIAVGTTNNESRPIFTHFVSLRAGYMNTFTFFVVANSIACGYMVLSLVISIFHIFKSAVRITRVIMIILDTVMLACLTAGASAAAAIVYLAHKGNNGKNWLPICQQYNSFCERVSGSLVGSFMGVLVLILLILLNAIALSKH